MSHFKGNSFNRFFALFIALTLAVPSSAFALRTIQPKNSGLEEEKLTAALKGSPAPVSQLGGLEEGTISPALREILSRLPGEKTDQARYSRVVAQIPRWLNENTPTVDDMEVIADLLERASGLVNPELIRAAEQAMEGAAQKITGGLEETEVFAVVESSRIEIPSIKQLESGGRYFLEKVSAGEAIWMLWGAAIDGSPTSAGMDIAVVRVTDDGKLQIAQKQTYSNVPLPGVRIQVEWGGAETAAGSLTRNARFLTNPNLNVTRREDGIEFRLNGEAAVELYRLSPVADAAPVAAAASVPALAPVAASPAVEKKEVASLPAGPVLVQAGEEFKFLLTDPVKIAGFRFREKQSKSDPGKLTVFREGLGVSTLKAGVDQPLEKGSILRYESTPAGIIVTVQAGLDIQEPITVQLDPDVVKTDAVQKKEAAPLPADQPVTLRPGRSVTFPFTGPVAIGTTATLEVSRSQSPKISLHRKGKVTLTLEPNLGPNTAYSFDDIRAEISYTISEGTPGVSAVTTVTISAEKKNRRPITVGLQAASPAAQSGLEDSGVEPKDQQWLPVEGYDNIIKAMGVLKEAERNIRLIETHPLHGKIEVYSPVLRDPGDIPQTSIFLKVDGQPVRIAYTYFMVDTTATANTEILLGVSSDGPKVAIQFEGKTYALDLQGTMEEITLADLEERKAAPLKTGQPVSILAGKEFRFLFAGPVQIVGVFNVKLEASKNAPDSLLALAPSGLPTADIDPYVDPYNKEYPLGGDSFLRYERSYESPLRKVFQFTVTIRAGKAPITVQLAPPAGGLEETFNHGGATKRIREFVGIELAAGRTGVELTVHNKDAQPSTMTLQGKKIMDPDAIESAVNFAGSGPFRVTIGGPRDNQIDVYPAAQSGLEEWVAVEGYPRTAQAVHVLENGLRDITEGHPLYGKVRLERTRRDVSGAERYEGLRTPERIPSVEVVDVLLNVGGQEIQVASIVEGRLIYKIQPGFLMGVSEDGPRALIRLNDGTLYSVGDRGEVVQILPLATASPWFASGERRPVDAVAAPPALREPLPELPVYPDHAGLGDVTAGLEERGSVNRLANMDIPRLRFVSGQLREASRSLNFDLSVGSRAALSEIHDSLRQAALNGIDSVRGDWTRPESPAPLAFLFEGANVAWAPFVARAGAPVGVIVETALEAEGMRQLFKTLEVEAPYIVVSLDVEGDRDSARGTIQNYFKPYLQKPGFPAVELVELPDDAAAIENTLRRYGLRFDATPTPQLRKVEQYLASLA